MLVIFATVVIASGAGWLACTALQLDPHPREMTIAAVAVLVASLLAVTPLVLTTGASQPAVAQAGLAGTVIHLLLCAILGGGALLVSSLALHQSYVFWLLGLYWATLIAMSILFVRAVKVAPVATPAGAANAALLKQSEH
jgi:hypothetical protein